MEFGIQQPDAQESHKNRSLQPIGKRDVEVGTLGGQAGSTHTDPRGCLDSLGPSEDGEARDAGEV